MNLLNALISGAIMMGFFTIGLFFLKFWRKTADFFFLVFALSFTLMGVERTILALFYDSELKPFVYILRLLAFLLIIFAVLYKNFLDKKNVS